MRYAVIRSGFVENVIELDPDSGWEPPAGSAVQAIGDAICGPGWTVDGASFAAPVIVDPVPETITRWQGRRWLLGAGLFTSVEAMIAAAGDAARIDYGVETWYRANALFETLAAAIFSEDTPEQVAARVDQMFREAAQIGLG